MGLPGFGQPWGSPTAYGPPTISKEQEIDALKGEAESLEDALEGIRKRVEELETEAKP
jgi:hypothetical protein